MQHRLKEYKPFIRAGFNIAEK